MRAPTLDDDATLRQDQDRQDRSVRAERLGALAEMAAGMVHGFNNMLATVLGRAQLLQAQTDDTELRHGLRAIEQAALEGARTVRRLEEFARQRGDAPVQPVDLNRLVHDVVELTRPRWRDEAQAKGLGYDVRVEATPVPPVAGDPQKLREALTNLVLNALDAMPAGGRLTLRTATAGGRVRCDVIDTGVGMTEDVRRRIFQPFFSTKAGSSGLGLSVTYGIVTRHGGEVDVESRPGEGSTLTVHLPSVPEAATPLVPPGAPARPGARVLVVDDEPGIRDVITTTLDREGYRVVTCASGHEAVARLDTEPFDLVVTDLGMRGLSGWDVAGHAKAKNPATPVVLVTGWGNRYTLEQVQARGVDFLVAKPFSLDELRVVIERALAAEPPPAAQPPS